MKLIGPTIVVSQPGSEVPWTEFRPGDDVPEWALRQIGAHMFEGGVHPLGDAAPQRVAGGVQPIGDAPAPPVSERLAEQQTGL